MDLYNFNPPKRNILINGDSYELSPFSIGVMTVVNRDFHGIDNFDKILKSANQKNGFYRDAFPDSAAWLCYELITEKEYLQSLCHFKAQFFRQKQDVYEQNINSLLATIEDSQPLLPGQETDQETDQETESGEQPEDNFSKTFVEISREIKFSIKEFYDLTVRQINQIITDLNILKNNDSEFIAKLHGRKLLKPAVRNIKYSKAEDELFKDFSEKQMEKLKNERTYS